MALSERCTARIGPRQVSALAALSLLCLALVAALGGTGPATAAPPAAAGQLIPPGVTPPAPVIYKFFDLGTDYQTLHPEYGPIGSMHFVTWEQINPGPGQYNWAAIDNQLAQEASLRVTLPDGRTIPKPVTIQVDLYLAQYPKQGSYFFYDCTPQWVYQAMGDRPSIGGRLVGHVLTCGTTRGVVPAYDSETWRSAHAEMVRALGERYGKHPQIAAVFICTGIDNETKLVKDTSGCAWGDIANQQAGGLSYNFQKFVREAVANYRAAFPTKPVYVLNGAGDHWLGARAAAAQTPPAGIKHCGLAPDWPSWNRMFATYETYSQTLPIWLETRYGLGNPEDRYWTFVAGLHYHPDAIDVHPEFITQSDPGWLLFVDQHLGRTVETTPDVWTVLRDSEFPLNPTTGESGHVGDWQFWLYRQDSEPGNKTVRLQRADLPAACQDQVYSRQARRTDQGTGNPYMSFNVDDGYPFAAQKPLRAGGAVAYRVDLKLLNAGSDTLSLEYRNWAGQLVRQTVRKGPALGPADRWVDLSFVLDDAYLANGLPGGADLRLSCNGDGDEVVHMVRVQGAWGGPPPPPTAAPPPPASGTPTPTPTRQPTSQAPPTPTPTAAPRSPDDASPPSGVLVLRPVADTYLDMWAPEANYGLKDRLVVRNGDVKTALLRFPTPALPPGAMLEQATLRLYSVGRSNSNGLQVAARQMCRPWEEMEANWQLARAGAPWGLPGATDPASDCAPTNLSTGWVRDLQAWTSLDVTAAVRAWLEAPSTNAGLALRGTSQVSVEYHFASAGSPDPATRPELCLAYRAPAAPTPTPAATATARPTHTPPPTATPRPLRQTLQQGVGGYAGQLDTFLSAWSPGTNYGREGTLYVRQGDVKALLLRFDLPAAPSGAALRSARLRLYVSSRSNPNPMQLQGYALQRPWEPAEATWLQAAVGSFWAAPGANAVPADRLGSAAFSLTLGATGTWVEADLTPLVRGWLASPAANHGLVLKGSGQVSVEYGFCGSRWWDARYRPQLVLEWDEL